MNFDRLIEHRGHAQRVDRAHGTDRVTCGQVDSMPCRSAGEGVGDGDFAGRVEVNEVFAGEPRKRGAWVEIEFVQSCSQASAAGLAALNKVAEHPVVELSLGIAKSARARSTATLRRYASCRERVRNRCGCARAHLLRASRPFAATARR